MAKAFIVAGDFQHRGRTHANYFQGLQCGFRSWTGDPKKALPFDTRATARRAARDCGREARVETIDLDASEGTA